MNALEERLVARVGRVGPLPFSEVMDAALYDPDDGFFATGGGAGRRGDFITSPEVGPLFGAVVANALDAWWDEVGQPDAFVVVEAGAGRGALGLAVLAARPRCAAALRYVLVERSALLRARHGDHLDLSPNQAAGGRGPVVWSTAEVPRLDLPGVLLANELLDNIAVDLLARAGDRWVEVRVGVAGGALVEVPGDEPVTRSWLPIGAAPGARVPDQQRAARWLSRARSRLPRCRAVVIDYASDTGDMARRPQASWLRTFRSHGRGDDPLVAVGTQDITCEVAADQLAAAVGTPSSMSQAAFLRRHGIDPLVDEGRRIWAERAHIGDLAAVRARSRVREADALLDPEGLGGFRVLAWPPLVH